MTATSKMVFGDQFQIRLDPSKLDAKSRKQWGELYVKKQFEKTKMFFTASIIAVASGASLFTGIQREGIFIPIGFVLGLVAIKAFFDFGYEKGILDDWETKIMVRVDK